MDPNNTRHARGVALLQDPRSNKGTAFSEEEREHEKLLGLLPEAVEDIETQRRRVLQHLGHKPSDIERYVYLIGLLDRNETLFYRVLMSDPARFLPIVYDPTVGEACLKFGHIYRRPRGLYLSMKHKGRVRDVLRNWPERDVRFICVSTGEDSAVAVAGSQGNFELNAMRPIIINDFLHSARILADGCEKFRTFSVEGTELHRERIAEFVDRSLMLVTALSPVIGYDKASAIAHAALDRGTTLKEAALKTGWIDERTFDEAVDPRKMAHPS